MSFIEADSGNVNPRYGTSEGYEKNCQSSVVTFIARLRGWNVEVLPFVKDSIMKDLSTDQSLAWINSAGEHPKFKFDLSANTMDKMKSFVESNVAKGEYCTLGGTWRGCNYGHIITVFRDTHGQLIYYDPQKNELKDDFGINEFFRLMNKGKSEKTAMKLLRIDDCNFDKSVVDYILTRRNKKWKKP